MAATIRLNQIEARSQKLEARETRTRSFIRVSQVSAGFQALGPALLLFQAYYKGANWNWASRTEIGLQMGCWPLKQLVKPLHHSTNPLNHDFYTFWCWQSNALYIIYVYIIVYISYKPYLESWTEVFPKLALYSLILSGNAERWQLQLPVNPMITRETRFCSVRCCWASMLGGQVSFTYFQDVHYSQLMMDLSRGNPIKAIYSVGIW